MLGDYQLIKKSINNTNNYLKPEWKLVVQIAWKSKVTQVYNFAVITNNKINNTENYYEEHDSIWLLFAHANFFLQFFYLHMLTNLKT